MYLLPCCNKLKCLQLPFTFTLVLGIHSSLLQYGNNYTRKMFYSACPRKIENVLDLYGDDFRINYWYWLLSKHSLPALPVFPTTQASLLGFLITFVNNFHFNSVEIEMFVNLSSVVNLIYSKQLVLLSINKLGCFRCICKLPLNNKLIFL